MLLLVLCCAAVSALLPQRDAPVAGLTEPLDPGRAAGTRGGQTGGDAPGPEGDRQDNIMSQLSSILDLLEASMFGMDLLKLHSVTTELLDRMDNMERNISSLTRNPQPPNTWTGQQVVPPPSPQTHTRPDTQTSKTHTRPDTQTSKTHTRPDTQTSKAPHQT
ncbi:hypothetical protein CRUP_030609 [Coryphaenoides rupestris]|nr:hypothetical protein CRUP_030609 [Coryphaenoides rupestris]